MNVEFFSTAEFLKRAKGTAKDFFEIESHQNPRAPYWNEKNYQDMLSEDLCLAISSDEKIIHAFLIYREVAPEVEILHWAVREKNCGNGEKFLRQFLEQASKKAVERVLLDCGEENSAAKALYEKLGFKIGARRKEYYSTGEAALLMSLKL